MAIIALLFIVFIFVIAFYINMVKRNNSDMENAYDKEYEYETKDNPIKYSDEEHTDL